MMPSSIVTLVTLWACCFATASALTTAATREAPLTARHVDSTLAKLRTALLDGRGTDVLAITDELRQPYQTLSKTVAAMAEVKDEVGHTSGACLFDDTLFSLTPWAKQELALELAAPAMRSAINWVRGGGWWSCASEGNTCACYGTVKLVDFDRVPLGTIDGSAFQGSVPCAGATFGVARPGGAGPPHSTLAWGCECHYHGTPASITDPTPSSAYHMYKRLSSRSYLQEAWIYLLRLLGHTQLLPTATGDRLYHGIENWAARSGTIGNSFPNIIMERFWLLKYMREVVAPHVQYGSKCLEWGNPETPGSGFTYAAMLPGCTQKFDMQYDFNYFQGVPHHIQGNIIYSDILSLPTTLGGWTMDVIFATQVFEHLAEPHKAAEALFQAISPGGSLVFTAPQMAQFHKVPHDYFRYTVEGAKYILVRAGFCVPNNYVAGGGDFVFDIGRDAGLQVQDFPLEEVEAGYKLGYDMVSHSAIGIHMLAFKPPHTACSDPTAGWDELNRQGIKP